MDAGHALLLLLELTCVLVIGSALESHFLISPLVLQSMPWNTQHFFF